MKTLMYLLLALISNCLFAQNGNIDKYFSMKPYEIKTQNSGIQEYDVTLKWQNLDAIEGKKFSCSAVNATYMVGLDNGNVGWKNVRLSQINDFNQKEIQGIELPAFNNFSYPALNTDFLKNDFYKAIPPEQQDLAKWLVSDGIQMQGLVWYVADSLEFNKAFYPKIMENNNIQFEDWVNFTSRYQKLIWSGITKYNNEICAIVKFESYYNPLEMNNQEMSFKGRSLYWGEIWISLQDKQVEYATMFEDVIFKLRNASFPQEQLIDLQREIVFEKNN
jgi:hypothetical protein